jgi:hypothetical protein
MNKDGNMDKNSLAALVEQFKSASVATRLPPIWAMTRALMF